MNKKLYNAPEVRELNYQTKGFLMMSTEGGQGPTQGDDIEEGEGDTNKRNAGRDATWGNLW